jgi:hypothetical protein
MDGDDGGCDRVFSDGSREPNWDRPGVDACAGSVTDGVICEEKQRLSGIEIGIRVGSS